MAVIVLNPSCQYGNVVLEAGQVIYNEGHNLFDIALKTKEALENLGHEVYLTRSLRDEASNLETEMQKANSFNPDLMVSLHSDATGEPINLSVGGTTTFFASEESYLLAEYVHHSLCRAIGNYYPKHTDRGIKTHWLKLYVLHNINAPACLTEILFHTNPEERKLLLDPLFHQIAAKAIAEGIDTYTKTLG